MDFETAVGLCLQTPPVSTFVTVLDDGTAQAATLQGLRTTDYLVGYSNSYIRLNLNAICHHASGKKVPMPPRTSAVELHGAELEVLRTLRDKDVEDVRLRFKQGELDEIEATRSVENNSRLAFILDEVAYGDVTIKRKDRKTSQISVTKKRRVKK